MRVKNISFSKRLLICLLSVIVAFSSFYVYRANATTTVAYPFRTGENAFANGSTWAGIAPRTVTTYEFAYYGLGTGVPMDYENGYIAIQLEPNASFAMMYYFDVTTPTGPIRFQTIGGTPENPGAPAYFVSESGEVTTINVIYDHLGFPNSLAGVAGMMVIPLSSFSNPSSTGSEDWSKVLSVGLIVNSQYNHSFSLKMGEVGYYESDTDTKMSKIITLDSQSANSQLAHVSNGTFTFIVGEGEQAPEVSTPEFNNGDVISYPLRTGQNNFANGALWSGVTQNADESLSGYQTLVFDMNPVDMSSKGYLAIQMEKVGSVDGGFTVFIQGKNYSGTDVRLQTYGGTPTIPSSYCYFVEESGVVTVIGVYYNAVVFPTYLSDKAGVLIVPVSTLQPSWDATAAQTFNWEEVKMVGLVTHSYYNYGFTYKLGEVAYYEESPKISYDYKTIFPLPSKEYYENFKYGETTGSTGSIARIQEIIVEPEQNKDKYTPNPNIKGYDTYLNFNGVTDVSTFAFDTNGTVGVLGTTTDTYGDIALTLKATQVGGDGYTVPYVVQDVQYNWSEGKGVMLWAKNLYEGEIGFNFEFDVRNNDEPNPNKRSRFNLAQGVRYYTYDLRTGVENIRQTSPAITLPKGFYGWVFVPFTSFSKPSWSIFNGPNALDFENIYVYQIGISINQKFDLNKTIAFNKIGIYKDIISISTSFKNSINGIENMYFSE